MFNSMRTLFGSKGGGLRKALEEKRRALARYGMPEMNALLGQWIDSELFKAEPTGCFSRKRCFDFGTTFQAFLWQVLQRQASCRDVVQQVKSSRFASGGRVPETGTGAYCRARSNLPMKRLQKINSAIQEKIHRITREEDRWMGREVKILDGTSLSMQDTPENAAVYSYGNGQKPGCGFPMIHLVGVFSLSNGAWLGYNTAGVKRHDLALSVELIDKHIQTTDVVLGDRGFCAYWMLALLKAKGADGLMRLHQARPVDFRKGKSLGKDQQLMVWTKPKRTDKCPLSVEEYDKLPVELSVRILRTQSAAKGQRTREVVLVTTLCDHEAISGEKLAELYGRRWQIELNFDDLKTSLGMDNLNCKSPRMVERAMMVYCSAYNLIRTLMMESAIRAQVPLQRLSFRGSGDALIKALTVMHGGDPSKTSKKSRQVWEFIIELVGADLLPVRPNRREPRAVKKRPKNFQLLTEHRSCFREIPHRHAYKAKKPLK